MIDGPLPNTKAIFAKVKIDNEFLGTVFAWPFLPAELTSVDKATLKKAAIELGLNANDVEKAVESFKAVTDANLYYMQELVQLVLPQMCWCLLQFSAVRTAARDKTHYCA